MISEPSPLPETLLTPALETLAGPFRPALTVDVEEWYHTCLVPELVDPTRRPAGLVEELDFLLPEILELFDQVGCKATFFVLGEVAHRHPGRVREIVAAGHEIASHSDLHFRVGERCLQTFRRDVCLSKLQLEELTGAAVLGFRAPEWSLHHPGNPRLPILAEEGYLYDSSLAPFLGPGRLTNPRRPYRLRWPAAAPARERTLLEVPPLTFGGPLRLPAGSWPGRLIGPRPVLAAAQARRGSSPVFVVHPWEISGRETPGRLRGLAGWVHETGRRGYRERFRKLLEGLPWTSLRESFQDSLAEGSSEEGAGWSRGPGPGRGQ